MQDLVSCTLTVDAPGYLVVRGRTLLWIEGATANYGYLQIDETAGGGLDTDYVEGGANIDALQVFPLSVERVYTKPAGTYVFRLEARSAEFNTSGAITKMFNHQITATYYPKTYGTVAP